MATKNAAGPGLPKAEAPASTSEGSKQDKPTPQKWWHWVLVYPTLVISILSSIPTYIELVGSTWLKVPFGQYKSAMKENELWKENIHCAAAPFDGLTNKHNVAVDAVVCQSGAVLVRVKPPEKQTTYKWVPLESVTPDRTAGFLLSVAFAAPKDEPIVVAQGAFVVVCQQWIGNGLIRRRIMNRMTNQCFDEVVNTYNGQVVSSSPAPCNC